MITGARQQYRAKDLSAPTRLLAQRFWKRSQTCYRASAPATTKHLLINETIPEQLPWLNPFEIRNPKSTQIPAKRGFLAKIIFLYQTYPCMRLIRFYKKKCALKNYFVLYKSVIKQVNIFIQNASYRFICKEDHRCGR